jgi:hypothetical protein
MYCMYEYQTTGSCVSKNWGSSFVLRVIFAVIVSAGMEFPFFLPGIVDVCRTQRWVWVDDFSLVALIARDADALARMR